MKLYIEELAYQNIKKNNPVLLQIIRSLILQGFSPETIIDICVEKTNQPRHRLSFIGCAADYIIRHARDATELIQ